MTLARTYNTPRPSLPLQVKGAAAAAENVGSVLGTFVAWRQLQGWGRGKREAAEALHHHGKGPLA
jgi:hypothetical protein